MARGVFESEARLMAGMLIGIPLIGMVLCVAFVLYLNLTGQLSDDDSCGSEPAVIEPRPLDAGWYGSRSTKMYVSVGIGTSILPVRFLCRPEIAIFDLVPR